MSFGNYILLPKRALKALSLFIAAHASGAALAQEAPTASSAPGTWSTLLVSQCGRDVKQVRVMPFAHVEDAREEAEIKEEEGCQTQLLQLVGGEARPLVFQDRVHLAEEGARAQTDSVSRFTFTGDSDTAFLMGPDKPLGERLTTASNFELNANVGHGAFVGGAVSLYGREFGYSGHVGYNLRNTPAGNVTLRAGYGRFQPGSSTASNQFINAGRSYTGFMGRADVIKTIGDDVRLAAQARALVGPELREYRGLVGVQAETGLGRFTARAGYTTGTAENIGGQPINTQYRTMQGGLYYNLTRDVLGSGMGLDIGPDGESTTLRIGSPLAPEREIGASQNAFGLALRATDRSGGDHRLYFHRVSRNNDMPAALGQPYQGWAIGVTARFTFSARGDIVDAERFDDEEMQDYETVYEELEIARSGRRGQVYILDGETDNAPPLSLALPAPAVR